MSRFYVPASRPMTIIDLEWRDVAGLSISRSLARTQLPPQHRDSNRSLCILADQARASTPFLRTAHNCRADKRQDRTRPDDIERATRPLPISGAHTAVFEKRARHLPMTRPAPSRPPAKENAAPEHARNRVFALPQGNGIRTCPGYRRRSADRDRPSPPAYRC